MFPPDYPVTRWIMTSIDTKTTIMAWLSQIMEEGVGLQLPQFLPLPHSYTYSMHCIADVHARWLCLCWIKLEWCAMPSIKKGTPTQGQFPSCGNLILSCCNVYIGPERSRTVEAKQINTICMKKTHMWARCLLCVCCRSNVSS